jgi:hypothetical protein
MEWSSVRDELPGIKKLTDNLITNIGDESYGIAVSIQPKIVAFDFELVMAPVLDINITELPFSETSTRKWVDELPVSPATPTIPNTQRRQDRYQK